MWRCHLKKTPRKEDCSTSLSYFFMSWNHSTETVLPRIVVHFQLVFFCFVLCEDEKISGHCPLRIFLNVRDLGCSFQILRAALALYYLLGPPWSSSWGWAALWMPWRNWQPHMSEDRASLTGEQSRQWAAHSNSSQEFGKIPVLLKWHLHAWIAFPNASTSQRAFYLAFRDIRLIT